MTTEEEQAVRDRVGQRIASLREEKGWGDSN